jgi:hypothetical protein
LQSQARQWFDHGEGTLWEERVKGGIMRQSGLR